MHPHTPPSTRVLGLARKAIDLKVNSLIEFLDAAVDTKYVQGPYDERGGLMLVGYPGSFKTTIIKAAMDHHHDAMVTSDMNVQQYLKMREDFVTGRYTALGFTDFEKIYQRHQSTSAHVEGIIQGLVAEGYGTGPSGDQRMPTIPAKMLVVGAMTNTCFETRYEQWQKSGFLRRFLWLVIAIQNQEAIVKAIRRWEKIDFGKVSVRPANKQIRVEISGERSRQLEDMMKYQPGFHGTAYSTLKKIVAVLEWKYSENGGSKRVTEILQDIKPALSKEGGFIIL